MRSSLMLSLAFLCQAASGLVISPASLSSRSLGARSAVAPRGGVQMNTENKIVRVEIELEQGEP